MAKKNEVTKEPVIVRGWINQPYGDRPLHSLNGSLVLFDENQTGEAYRVYFTKGEITNQMVPRQLIFKGWPKEFQRKA